MIVRAVRWQLALIVFLLAAACTPTHTVKPLPNFVRVGLEPGDRIRITTRSGEAHDVVVTEVRSDRIVGEDDEYLLEDLVSIKKSAWERPESPCGGGRPLGCSVPWLVSLASEAHGHYKEQFYDACAQHDYCYRHGHASYGKDRKSCDDAFLEDMRGLCPDAAASGFGRMLEVFDDSVGSRQTCETVANDFYQAVRRYGADRFETTFSTYCEYDGPPSGAPRAPGAPTAEETAPTS